MGRHFRRALIALLMMGIFAGACVVRTGPGRRRHAVAHKHKKHKHHKHAKHRKHKKHRD